MVADISVYYCEHTLALELLHVKLDSSVSKCVATLCWVGIGGGVVGRGTLVSITWFGHNI